MARDAMLTDAQVEIEIARLMDSEYVKLSKAEAKIREKRRRYMYWLRTHEKHGKALAAEGYTLENISRLLGSDIEEDSDEQV